MSEPNYTPLLSEMVEQNSKPKPGPVRWFCGILCLALVSLSTGSVNLFPSLIKNFTDDLHFSKTFATVMLTGGTTIMYITLPAGLFMDRFGDDITLLISMVTIAVSYLVLFFITSYHVLFMIVYWIMAFGCASMFLACLQVALSRNQAVKGVSASIVSSSLSLAFGLLFKVYNLGPKIFKSALPVVGGIKVIAITVIAICIIFGLIGRFCYIGYVAPPMPSGGEVFSKKTVLTDSRLYVLLFTMMLTVFDGMLVIAAGVSIWEIFDPTYTEAVSTWSFYFSIVNCVFTIGLSALLDFMLKKFESTRTRVFSIFWMILSAIPIVLSISLNQSKSRILFGIFMSCMGIPFGFGLTQVPAMTSDVFGNNQYGFAFGIIQFGSIVSALLTMPLMQSLKITGVTSVFVITGIAHVVIGVLWFFLQKKSRGEYLSANDNLIASPTDK